MDSPSLTLGEDRDKELTLAFPGSVLTHVLSIRTDDQLGLAIEALQVARESGVELQALNLARRGDQLEHQLKLTGPSPRAARLLANRIAALAGVTGVTVEHHLARRSS